MKHTRFLSVLLSVLFLFSALSLAAFADEKTPAGTVTISFEDYGNRDYLYDLYDDDICHPEPYGEIFAPTEVAIYEGETLADAAVRFLTENNVEYGSSSQYGWALSWISFTSSTGEAVTEFGGGSITPDDDYLTPFSGWMVAVNNNFGSGLSYIPAEDGDIVRFMYTCEMGADIHGDFYHPSAAVTNLTVTGGTLTPAFDAAVKDYTLAVSADTDTVKVAAELENMNAVTTYTADGVTYKYLRDIPVENGTVITVETKAERYDNTTWEVIETLTDKYTLTVEKEQPAPDEPAPDEPTPDAPVKLTLWQRIVKFFTDLFAKLRDFFRKIPNWFK